MPHKGPLCPAFTHAQSLTLSPIQETLYSPLHTSEKALFDDFTWAGVFSPLSSRNNSPALAQTAAFVVAPSGLASRLDKLTLHHGKTASAPPALAFSLNLSVGSDAGLGIQLTAGERRRSSVSTYIPPGNHNQQQRKHKRRHSAYDASVAFNYEEDDVEPRLEPASELRRAHASSAKADAGQKRSDDGDLLPLQSWLHDRLEDAAAREQFEAEADAAMSAASSFASLASLASLAGDGCAMHESATFRDVQTAVLTERRVVQVPACRTTASLRARETVLGTPPRQAAVQSGQVGMLGPVRKESPRNSIFSPTGRDSGIRAGGSVIIGVAAVHTHKRKASNTSDLSARLTASGAANMPARGNKNKKIRRSSLSTLAFTSNALTPLFSSAFLKTMNGGDGTGTPADEFGKKTDTGAVEENEACRDGAQAKTAGPAGTAGTAGGKRRSLFRTVSFVGGMRA